MIDSLKISLLNSLCGDSPRAIRRESDYQRRDADDDIENGNRLIDVQNTED